jgi:hypothetical protein
MSYTGTGLPLLPPDNPAMPQDRSKARPESQRKQKGGRNSLPRHPPIKLFIFFTGVIQKEPP